MITFLFSLTLTALDVLNEVSSSCVCCDHIKPPKPCAEQVAELPQTDLRAALISPVVSDQGRGDWELLCGYGHVGCSSLPSSESTIDLLEETGKWEPKSPTS